MLKILLILLFFCLSVSAGSCLAFVDTFRLASDIYYQQQAAKYASFQSDKTGKQKLENRFLTGVCGTCEYERALPEIGRISATKLDYWAVRAVLFAALIFSFLRIVSALFLRLCRELRIRFLSLVMALVRMRLIAIAASLFCMLSSTLVLPAMAAPADTHGSANGAVSVSGLGITDADVAMVKGEVGVAVVDPARKKHFMLNQNKPFPMQSVCKLPIAIVILRLADAGKLSIQDKITVRRSDVVPFHSPIKEAIKGKQSDFTIRELITRSVCTSDNTACDILISRAGGANAVTALLKEAGVSGIRIDRPEGTLQPESVEIAKFLTDPRDTSTPEAMVVMLHKLYSGNLLSKSSTAVILEDLFNCKTGPARIRAGLPAGWTLAHKTGTGRDVADQNTATNDVGVAVGPHGETIYIAVFTKGSRATIEVREAFMAKVAAQAVAGKL